MEEKSLANANAANRTNDANVDGQGAASPPQQMPSDDGAGGKAAAREDKDVNREEPKKEQPRPPVQNARRVERRKVNIFKFGRKIKHALRFVHPGFISIKLKYYYSEYRRILMLSRKPTPKEYKELTIMVAIGTLIVGVIGFAVQLIIQFI